MLTGLNWFMPALVKSRVGSLCGTTEDEGHAVCSLLSKNLMKASLVRATLHSGADMICGEGSGRRARCALEAQ